MENSDELYCEHIRDAIEKIESYVRDVSFTAFEKNLLVQDGVIREFEIIGEAAKHLSDEFQEQHQNIPWRQVMSMRDRLVHEYFNVDTELVWKTIQSDLPALKHAVHS